MIQWTADEKATLHAIWQKFDIEQDGPEVFKRLFLVYSWTVRDFGDPATPAEAAGNAKLTANGKKVLDAITEAINQLDDVKGPMRHIREIKVDPENLKRLGSVLAVFLATKLGADFTPQHGGIWERFFAHLVYGLRQNYY